jgi:hypothetical protein
VKDRRGRERENSGTAKINDVAYGGIQDDRIFMKRIDQSAMWIAHPDPRADAGPPTHQKDNTVPAYSTYLN